MIACVTSVGATTSANSQLLQTTREKPFLNELVPVCSGYLFYQGSSPTGSPVTLPMGSYDDNFLNEVEVYIIDSIGDYYVYEERVTVYAQQVSQIVLADGIIAEIADSSSNISRYLRDDDYQSALQYVYSGTSQINLPSDYVSPPRNVTD